MIDEAIAENKELRKQVSELSGKVTKLEGELQATHRSMTLILEYLKKMDIKDPFLDKIVGNSA